MYEQEPQRFTFSSSSFNESVDISVGGEGDLVLEDILKAFRGFLIASGFDYVNNIEAVYHNGDSCSTRFEYDEEDKGELSEAIPEFHPGYRDVRSIPKSEYEHAVSMSGDAEPF